MIEKGEEDGRAGVGAGGDVGIIRGREQAGGVEVEHEEKVPS